MTQPPREHFLRRSKPRGPEYVLRKVEGLRFCPKCRQERPWTGGIKTAGWTCAECAK